MSEKTDIMSTEQDSGPHGTFACPICGHDKPHPHSEAVQYAYWEDQIRRDGWFSSAKVLPKESGWYLCNGITVPLDQQQKPEHFSDHAPKWSQLSWFLWVRQGAARDIETRVPEVLYFDRLFQRWSLRNLLGNAVVSGEDVRWQVIAYPKYWREIPALNLQAVEEAKRG